MLVEVNKRTDYTDNEKSSENISLCKIEYFLITMKNLTKSPGRHVAKWFPMQKGFAILPSNFPKEKGGKHFMMRNSYMASYQNLNH